ncbi:unnamed protein product [Rhizophagus irregularis]|nr:unnamed protein product [Rhizophagus irregularis]
MSSYSSLSRVLSPFRVQTKFEENSLSASSTKRYMADITLYCYLLDTPINSAIPVDIGETTRVEGVDVPIKKFSFGHLKKQIWPNNNEANKLRLWKFETPFKKDNEQLKTLNENFRNDAYLEQVLGEDLIPGELIRTIFPVGYVFPPNHIHIVVQPPPPATGKRKTEDLDEGNGNKKYKEEILEFLENKAIEQKILTFINSLNSIDTNKQVLKLPPLPGDDNKTAIYKRKCYNYLNSYIFNNNNRYNRFLIIGNPGIGKTYFGRLMLVELLKRGKKVLFDNKDCTLYIDPNGSVYRPNSYEYKLFAQAKDTWCIIDGRPPQISHDWSAGKFIMVSSPKRDIIKDFDKPTCKTFYMPTWDEDELLECWKSLYESKITEETIKRKFNLCGGIPRWIFDSLTDSKIICEMIDSASKSIDSCILDYQAKLFFFGHEFSHKIIHIHTNLEDTEDPYTDHIYRFASKFAGNLCIDHLKKHNKEKLSTFILNARNLKEMCGGGRFLTRKLTDRGTEPEVFKEFEPDLKERIFWSVDEIKYDIQQRQKNYYRPNSGTFESIDSYIYPNKMFQITVSRRHNVK